MLQLSNWVQLQIKVSFIYALQPLKSIHTLNVFSMLTCDSSTSWITTSSEPSSHWYTEYINALQVWTVPSSLALLGESLLISLPPGTKIFQFPGLAILSNRSYDQVSLFGHSRVEAYSAAHRDLSQPYHVLHRLLLPRHPPYTLSNLNFFLSYLQSTY